MMIPSPPLRGCGIRTPGGVYLTTEQAFWGGCPVEHFLLHPPRPVDPDALGLAAQGEMVQDWGRESVLVLQVVGQKFYPTVADFIEEVRQKGLSRKVNDRSFPWEQVRGKTLFLGLVHPRGYWPPTPEEWTWALERVPRSDEDWEQGLACPLTRPREMFWAEDCRVGLETCSLEPRVDDGTDGGFCPRLYWTDFDPDDLQEVGPEGRGTRWFVDFGYPAWAGGRRPETAPALFAVFPIHRIEVIRDREGAAEQKARRIAEALDAPLGETSEEEDPGLVVTLADE